MLNCVTAGAECAVCHKPHKPINCRIARVRTKGHYRSQNDTYGEEAVIQALLYKKIENFPNSERGQVLHYHLMGHRQSNIKTALRNSTKYGKISSDDS